MEKHQERKPEKHRKKADIMCKHCGRSIAADSYLLHEVRCGLRTNRARQTEEIQKEEDDHPQSESTGPNSKKTSEKKEQIKQPSQKNGGNRERQKIFQNKPPRTQQEIQKIPCHFCGHPQTLAELDTHPQNCEHRQEECTNCRNKFPKSLMGQHRQVCRRPNNQRRQQPQRNLRSQRSQAWLNWMEDEQEDEDDHHFGNLGRLFSSQRRQFHPLRPQLRELRREPFPMRQVFRDSQRDRPENNRRNPFIVHSNFFSILEMMAARQGPSQHQGMTNEQIKNLKKYKYNGDNASKKEEDKDLCAICYCQFEKDQRLVELKCKHSYHQECIIKWVAKTAKCPVCNAPQTNRSVRQQ